MGPKSVFGVGMLVFTLRATPLPQWPLSLCFERLKQIGSHYLANKASRWHLISKNALFWHGSKKFKSQNNFSSVSG